MSTFRCVKAWTYISTLRLRDTAFNIKMMISKLKLKSKTEKQKDLPEIENQNKKKNEEIQEIKLVLNQHQHLLMLFMGKYVLLELVWIGNKIYVIWMWTKTLFGCWTYWRCDVNEQSCLFYKKKHISKYSIYVGSL